MCPPAPLLRSPFKYYMNFFGQVYMYFTWVSWEKRNIQNCKSHLRLDGYCTMVQHTLGSCEIHIKRFPIKLSCTMWCNCCYATNNVVKQTQKMWEGGAASRTSVQPWKVQWMSLLSPNHSRLSNCVDVRISSLTFFLSHLPSFIEAAAWGIHLQIDTKCGEQTIMNVSYFQTFKSSTEHL